MIDAEYEELDEGEGELDLIGSDSLPWLESGEEDESAGGLDTSQLVGFAAILAALLGLLVGGVWFFTNQMGGDEVVADGSVIEAPAGPIRERPEDPGGKEFAGTGNVAPVVGEGGTRPAVVAQTDAAGPARPAPTTGPGPGPAASPAPDMSGVGVQLAAYSSRTRAEQGWSDLIGRTDALAGVRHRVVEGRVDIGTVYRLQAIAADRAEAERLCAALKADGLDCQIKQ